MLPRPPTPAAGNHVFAPAHHDLFLLLPRSPLPDSVRLGRRAVHNVQMRYSRRVSATKSPRSRSRYQDVRHDADDVVLDLHFPGCVLALSMLHSNSTCLEIGLELWDAIATDMFEFLVGVECGWIGGDM